jgi:hypothetical protein
MNVAATERGAGVMAAQFIEHFHAILLSLVRSAAWLAILMAIFVPLACSPFTRRRSL